MLDHHLRQVDDALGIGEHDDRLRVQLQGRELLGEPVGIDTRATATANLEIVHIESLELQMLHDIVERADHRIQASCEQPGDEHQTIVARPLARRNGSCGPGIAWRGGQQLIAGRSVDGELGTHRGAIGRLKIQDTRIGQRRDRTGRVDLLRLGTAREPSERRHAREARCRRAHTLSHREVGDPVHRTRFGAVPNPWQGAGSGP